jgi:hypothetical protein
LSTGVPTAPAALQVLAPPRAALTILTSTVLVGECGQLLEHRWLSGLLGVAPEGVCEVGVHRLVAFQGLDPGPPQGVFVER